jgi:hypothetical protein
MGILSDRVCLPQGSLLAGRFRFTPSDPSDEGGVVDLLVESTSRLVEGAQPQRQYASRGAGRQVEDGLNSPLPRFATGSVVQPLPSETARLTCRTGRCGVPGACRGAIRSGRAGSVTPRS